MIALVSVFDLSIMVTVVICVILNNGTIALCIEELCITFY